MAENRPIEEKIPKPKTVGKSSLFTQMEELLAFDNIFLPENYSKYILKFAWVVILGFVYIFNAHVSERFSRERDVLVKKVEDLRTHYTTLHADVMYQSKESEIAKKVQELGLTDNTAPIKIVVEKK